MSVEAVQGRDQERDAEEEAEEQLGEEVDLAVQEAHLIAGKTLVHLSSSLTTCVDDKSEHYVLRCEHCIGPHSVVSVHRLSCCLLR